MVYTSEHFDHFSMVSLGIRKKMFFFRIPRDTIEKVSSSLSLPHLQFFCLVLGQEGCWEQPIGSHSKPYGIKVAVNVIGRYLIVFKSTLRNELISPIAPV